MLLLLVNIFQLYSVPPGTIFPLPSAGTTEKVDPLQISVCSSNTSGLGVTVTCTKKLLPTHPPPAPEVGVT